VECGWFHGDGTRFPSACATGFSADGLAPVAAKPAFITEPGPIRNVLTYYRGHLVVDLRDPTVSSKPEAPARDCAERRYIIPFWPGPPVRAPSLALRACMENGRTPWFKCQLLDAPGRKSGEPATAVAHYRPSDIRPLTPSVYGRTVSFGLQRPPKVTPILPTYPRRKSLGTCSIRVIRMERARQPSSRRWDTARRIGECFGSRSTRLRRPGEYVPLRRLDTA
jgi:hypothetical protein